MPKRVIDKSLIDEILKGNTTLFHWITDEYYDAIKHHVFKIVKNKEESEDLTNDIFTKVYDNLNLYKAEYTFNSWIYKIATNLAIDYLRKKKTSIELHNGLENHESVIDDSTPMISLVDKEDADSLNIAISKLKPIYRLIVRMRYYEELSYEEIATKLVMPIGTVKAYLHRAKQNLIKIIKNQDV